MNDELEMINYELAYIYQVNLKKIKAWYETWKVYIRVDVIMYLVMILLFVLILLFYL